MSVSAYPDSFRSKAYHVCQNILGSWEHGGHGFCIHLHVQLVLVTVTRWNQFTYELVLPDSGVYWSCGGVNPRSSHGSHLRCGRE